MNKSIITYIHTDRTVYHTSQPNLPNFYALHPKIAQKYFDVNNIFLSKKGIIFSYTVFIFVRNCKF